MIIIPEMTGQQEAEALLEQESKAAAAAGAEPPAGTKLFVVSNR